jgi:S1-C subfamily serine protease
MAMLATLTATRGAHAQDIRTAARAILLERQDSIVWVSAVVKTQISGRGAMLGHGMESKAETLGTVVSPSGLTVIAYSEIDNSALLKGAFGAGFRSAGEDMKFEPLVEISDVKIRLADNTEIPATVVLKDTDLDLAILKPDAQAGKPLVFKPVLLEKMPELQMLDDVVAIGRQGKALDRQPLLSMGQISSVVRKPRLLYSVHLLLQKGTPVFALDGKLVGISATAQIPDIGGGMPKFSEFLPVVVPAEAIKDLVEQAAGK